MYKIKKIKQTCSACPSQWEAETVDGYQIYIRYRWGYLSVRISNEPSNDISAGVLGNEIFGKQIGGRLDGVMSYEELKEKTAEVVRYP